MNHMMIDLETLGVSRDSVILSAGILIFDSNTLLDSDHIFMDTREQIQKGRTINAETVRWWIMTDRAAFATLCGIGDSSLKELSSVVSYLYKQYNVKRVWSRGSMDLVIMKDIMEVPWGYGQERDVRTLDELGKMASNGHNALEDCRNQAAFVQRILKEHRDE